MRVRYHNANDTTFQLKHVDLSYTVHASIQTCQLVVQAGHSPVHAFNKQKDQLRSIIVFVNLWVVIKAYVYAYVFGKQTTITLHITTLQAKTKPKRYSFQRSNTDPMLNLVSLPPGDSGFMKLGLDKQSAVWVCLLPCLKFILGTPVTILFPSKVNQPLDVDSKILVHSGTNTPGHGQKNQFYFTTTIVFDLKG